MKFKMLFEILTWMNDNCSIDDIIDMGSFGNKAYFEITAPTGDNLLISVEERGKDDV